MTEVLRLSAFSDSPEGGNPAGVVVDASHLTEGEMQEIAREVGYSETAFLTRLSHQEKAFAIRYFTPETEVSFCGHATIASGVVLGRQFGDGVYELSTPAGPIAVDVNVTPEAITATLTSPPTSSSVLEQEVLYDILDLLDWEDNDLDNRFPPAVAFAGNAHPVLVTASRQRLSRLDYDYDGLKELMQRHEYTTIQLVYPKDGDPHERIWFSRNVAPGVGIYEDAATGSAAAALGAYFLQQGIYGSGDHITIFQGDDMGRPSTLLLAIGSDHMNVTGTAVDID